MSVEEEVAALVKVTTEVNGRIIGQADDWDKRVEEKRKEVDDFMATYKLEKIVQVNKEYTPIIKFRSAYLSSVFRFAIAETTTSFVFAGIFDFICSHAKVPMIFETASTRYGTVSIKIEYDNYGNGYMSIKRDTGTTDVAGSMHVVVTPYNGSVEFFDGTIPTQDNTYEQSFHELGA